MGRLAYRASAAFRDAVGEADALLSPALGWSLAAAIADGVEAERLARADIAQPLLFAIQVGIVGVLRRLGIEASGHVGHSVGEIAAAWGAGALSLAEAVRVVVARSRNQERTRGIGRMAALGLGAAAARELLDELGGGLEIGAINATQSVTVSGAGEAIERLADEARRRGIACRPLDLDFAFHSAAMDPIRGGLLDDLSGLRSQAPQSLLVSTVTGEAVGAGLLDAEYWWRNVRSPVRFVEAMAGLVAAGHRIFVEIGPSPILQSYLHDALRAGEAPGRVLATLSRRDGDGDPFPAVAAQCHVAGHDISGLAWFDGPSDPAGLPLYPWQRERFWFESTVEGPDLANPQFVHPLLGFRQLGPEEGWRNHLDPERLPWLADHAIEGVPVLPAAAVLETALAAARAKRPEARALELVDVELRRPLPFDNGRARELRTVMVGADGDWELLSRPRLSREPPTLHALAQIATAGEAHAAPPPLPAGPARRQVGADALYRIATRLGLDYGPSFRTVAGIAVYADTEAVVELDAAVLADPPELYLIHPALLDGALQGLLALLAAGRAELHGVSFLPWRFGRVRLAAPFGRLPRRAHLRVTRLGTRSALADIVLYDEAGAAVAELFECGFRRVELRGGGAVEDRALHVDLVPAPLAVPAPPAGLAETLPALAAARRGDGAAPAEQALLLDALVAAVVERAVRDLAGSDAPFTVEALMADFRLAPESAPWLDEALRLLARFGAVAEQGGEWRLAASDLPEVAELWRLLLAEAPQLVGELALVAMAAEELPAILRDGPRQPEAQKLPMIEHLLYASPVAAGGIGFVADALAAFAARWPEGRPLRVLELGAGGPATRRLLDRLGRGGVAFSYVATSPDAETAARLAFVAAAANGAEALCWSPGDDGFDPGSFDPGSFDIVLGVNAGATLALDRAVLARLRDLIAPGGVLLAVEPEPNPLWELVFGRYAWWWERDAPLRRGEEWCGELAAAGFETPGCAVLASGAWPLAAWWATAPAAEPEAVKPPMPLAVAVVADDPRHAARWEDALAAAGCRAGEDGAVVFLADDADDAAHALARLARAAPAAAERRQRLYVVTAGAQHDAVGGAIWGFGRVLINETMPRLALHLVDLAPELPIAERARIVAAELDAASEESEIVWNAAGRHVLRLRRGLPPRWAAAGDALALGSDQPGTLDALGWRRAAPRPAGPGEVEIEVAASGLNFRDLMWAMGLLPEEALIDGFAGPSFGLECAGTVRAVGPGVENLAVGDRVAGFAPAALASRVTTAAHAVTKIPPELDFAAAATVPVAFVTAIYALGTLAQLAAGEYVLIHAAAGGVGLAAIQYARHRGAVVIATAGSELKRGFLRLAGADHVLDSRDLGFADAVRAITGGAGVDVVLNSLSGEAMEASIAVLKPFGRFLELGKRDFYLNRRVHLRPFRQNVSYFAIDVDQLPVRRPELARALLGEISEALAAGAIRPLAHRVFGFAEIDEAFRLMQGAGHIGKLVLVPDGNRAVRLCRPPPVPVRGDRTYFVTGGISGFGFAAARWLVARGARRLALLGRRGADTPGAAERVAELEAAGATVRLYAGDVADAASLGAVLDRIRAELPPLCGVVHAASAIADGLAAEIEAAAAAEILRPKLAGALALDALTRADPIELFLLFSSATTLLGAPGQGVYVAANLGLEALARRRHAEGLPALAVAWGPIADAGYLADRPDTRDALARRLGAKPISAAEALAGLDAAAASGLPVVALAETSWSEARRFLPILATPLFAELHAEAGALPSDDSLLLRLAEVGPEEALALLRTVVAEEAATILRLPAAGIEPQRPLSELGMDSLMAVELRLALETRLRIDLPLVSLAEGTSVASIAARLAGAISARPQGDDLVGLAARYEVAEDAGMAAVAEGLVAAD
jgi:acyl transferase domain-containing protein/NADPH:quinone reductase-like Zn-dependent oxidoreductase/acyl carrier protein